MSLEACLAEVLPSPRAGLVRMSGQGLISDEHGHWRLKRHNLWFEKIPREVRIVRYDRTPVFVLIK